MASLTCAFKNLIKSSSGLALLRSNAYSFQAYRSLSITPVNYGLFERARVDPAGKGVLVTGCDTGFGNAVAKLLHENGYTVYAGVLSKDSDGAKALVAGSGGKIHTFPMDVTSDASCNQAMDYIRSNLPPGSKGLWGVITNAGWSTFGQVEWVPMDVFQKIMEINFLGTVRTIKSALPLIRREKGRVVTVASMLGRFGANSRAAYTTTKWAVEGLSECLRLEMAKWDVKVVIMEPGNFVAGTQLYAGDAVQKQADYMWSKMPKQVQDDYTKEFFDSAINTMSGYTACGNTNINLVCQGMVDAISHVNPKPRYMIMNWQEYWRCWTASHLPSWIYDKYFG